MNGYKELILAAFGVIGGFIATLLGGWDTALQTLVIFMATDYFSGIMAAGIFKNSSKTANGRISSAAGWKGIAKKVMSLLMVLIACRLDILLDTTFARDAVIIAIVSNEAISIIENAGLMGVPIPSGIKKALEVLNTKKNAMNSDDTNNENGSNNNDKENTHEDN